MRWNGSDITGIPTFIFHDELVDGLDQLSSPPTTPEVDGPGRLVCRSETQATINWLLANGVPVTTSSNGNFVQRRFSTGAPSYSRMGIGVPLDPIFVRTDDVTNGLFSCNASGMTTLYVGLYGRDASEQLLSCLSLLQL